MANAIYFPQNVVTQIRPDAILTKRVLVFGNVL